MTFVERLEKVLDFFFPNSFNENIIFSWKMQFGKSES